MLIFGEWDERICLTRLHRFSRPCDHLRDPDATKALFTRYKPTHVIHLAALGAP